MDRQFARELAGRLGDKARLDGEVVRALVQHGDTFLPTRVRIDPTAEVFVSTRALDGFELAIRWGDRRGDPDVGDEIFDRAFGLETNDAALMRAWLDKESRDALLRSAYTYEADDISLATMLPMIATRTWTYEVANDEVVATKGTLERNIDRFVVAVDTACTLAARSHRWATAYAEIARKIGGHAAGDVQIGGEPVLTATRSAIDVSVRLVRRRLGVERLRTLVSAPRLGDGRLLLWDDDARKLARPPFDGKRCPLELGSYRLRASDARAAAKLDDAAKKLVTATQPVIVIVDADSVDLWFEGALSDHVQIDMAVALAAQLAVDAIAPQGPYR